MLNKNNISIVVAIVYYCYDVLYHVAYIVWFRGPGLQARCGVRLVDATLGFIYIYIYIERERYRERER